APVACPRAWCVYVRLTPPYGCLRLAQAIALVGLDGVVEFAPKGVEEGIDLLLALQVNPFVGAAEQLADAHLYHRLRRGHRATFAHFTDRRSSIGAASALVCAAFACRLGLPVRLAAVIRFLTGDALTFGFELLLAVEIVEALLLAIIGGIRLQQIDLCDACRRLDILFEQL